MEKKFGDDFFTFLIKRDPRTYEKTKFLIALVSIYNPMIHEIEVKTIFLNDELIGKIYKE